MHIKGLKHMKNEISELNKALDLMKKDNSTERSEYISSNCNDTCLY